MLARQLDERLVTAISRVNVKDHDTGCPSGHDTEIAVRPVLEPLYDIVV
jgi:hypothetical protein